MSSPAYQRKRAAIEPVQHNPDDDLVGRGIAEWRTARPDLDSSGKEIIGRLIRLQEVVLKGIDEALRTHNLTYFEYAVLATLRVSSEPYGLAPGYLLSRLLCSSGGLSNLLKRLEKRGLVARAADPDDGRGVLVQLTDAGHELANQAMPTHAAAEIALVSMLSTSEREVLAGLLSRMLVGNAPELMLATLEGRKPKNEG
ncbi:MarR family winged helix-turn-helix transcriptional regulator [Pusillimonas sp. ANT_WB101]|uniref:MarR family winged helix-turn-helix transcriptional regulator n=1 Tax=Pusillimonas sp. ANT_WB101 TaxID=2597356 RepID=UPI0011ECE845|nr:MarR family transcriptional regulator [Pusillimonas sp. ANT_WB101]KAA0911257.1 MarR family transcriptional regulator [Pusillimonas sp. ANT_WB101]